MSDHAKLSPSAADRWWVCPASVPLSDGMPNRTSAYAEEGTVAHRLAEIWLTGKAPEFDPPKEMRDNVSVYVNYVRDVHDAESDAKALIEHRVAVDDYVWGTADAIIWLPKSKQLHIIDLKYGAGVPVEVFDNLQLKIYALAAMLTCNYSATSVTATIVQPRCYHSSGPIRSVTYDAMDLLEFNAELGKAVDRVKEAIRANDLDPYINPSDKGCRWCVAAPKCPALRTLANSKAREVFQTGVAYDPISLAKALDEIEIIEAWIANVREFAYAEAERGHVPPGYKLVDKVARRKWRGAEDEIAEALWHDFKLEPFDIYERKLFSPAAVEKLLSKEDRAKLAELTVKESSGRALVHNSDKRPPATTDAKTAFSPIK